MARTFAEMKTNVGNMIQDTSLATSTLVGVWLNDRYRDISRRCLWSALVDNDYTFLTTASVATYSLPASFDQEIFVANITDGTTLKRYNEGMWWSERAGAYSSGVISTGEPSKYVVLREAGKIQLDPSPCTSTETIAMPYKKFITELSSSTGTTAILDIEHVMELGAVADGLAYKKQYAKSDYYNQKYEGELATRIGQERKQYNQLYQWISASYKMDGIHRLTGDNSYDSLI